MKRSHVFLFALLLLPAAVLAQDEKKDKSKFEMTADEKKLVELTNNERAKAKLPPLEPSPLLFKIAREHSANMAKQGMMNHVLDGKNPADRAKAAGYDWARLAENIAAGENTPLADVMKGWMESKIHRDNILINDVTEIGIGVARSEKSEEYYTQVFGRPKRKR